MQVHVHVIAPGPDRRAVDRYNACDVGTRLANVPALLFVCGVPAQCHV